jgi:Phytochelatin synthase
VPQAALKHCTITALGATARDYLAAKDHFVIVNYLRRAIGRESGGTCLATCGYDAKADWFLILEVARSVWVRAFDAARKDSNLATADKESPENREISRLILKICRPTTH